MENNDLINNILKDNNLTQILNAIEDCKDLEQIKLRISAYETNKEKYRYYEELKNKEIKIMRSDYMQDYERWKMILIKYLGLN